MKPLRPCVLGVSIFIAVAACRKEPVPSTGPVERKAPPAPQREPSEHEKMRDFLGQYLALPASERGQASLAAKVNERLEKLSGNELSDLLKSMDLDKEFNDPFVYRVLENLAKKDPASFIAYATGLKMKNYVCTSKDVAREAVKADRATVEDWLAHDNASSYNNIEIARNFLEILTGGDYSRQVEFLAAHPESSWLLREQTYMAWAKADMGAAFESAKKIADRRANYRAINSVLYAGGSIDAGRAYELASSVDPEVVERMQTTLFIAWTKQDLWAASAALEEMPASRILGALSLPGQAEVIGRDNPSTAIDALSKLMFTKTTAPLFSRVAETIARQDRAKAVGWINQFPESPAKQEILSKITK